MIEKIIVLGLLSLLSTTAFSPMGFLATSRNQLVNVAIEDIIVERGGILTVPIMITNATDVVGAHILLTFNPGVLQVMGGENSDFNFITYSDINNTEGYARLAAVNTLGGLNGDIKFIDINLKGIGNCGDVSLLDLDVVALLDSNSQEIERIVNDGQLSIFAEYISGSYKKCDSNGATIIKHGVKTYRRYDGICRPWSELNITTGNYPYLLDDTTIISNNTSIYLPTMGWLEWEHILIGNEARVSPVFTFPSLQFLLNNSVVHNSSVRYISLPWSASQVADFVNDTEIIIGPWKWNSKAVIYDANGFYLPSDNYTVKIINDEIRLYENNNSYFLNAAYPIVMRYDSWVVGTDGNIWSGNVSYMNTTEVQSTGNVELTQLVDDYLSYWRLDEGSGTTAHDENVTSGRDVTITGGSWTAEGLYFDGSTYIDTGWDYEPSTTTITGSMRDNVSDATYREWLGKYGSYYFQDRDNVVVSYVFNDTVTASQALTENAAWGNYTFTFDNVTVEYFTDDVSQGTDSLIGPVDDSNYNLHIGDYAGSGDFIGWIRNVRVYGRKLSDEEIAHVCDNNHSVVGNLTSWHDSGEGNEVYKISWNVTCPTGTSISLNTYNNDTEAFLQNVIDNITTSGDVTLSTKAQDTRLNITFFGNLTGDTPELMNITFFTQAVAAGEDSTPSISDEEPTSPVHNTTDQLSVTFLAVINQSNANNHWIGDFGAGNISLEWDNNTGSPSYTNNTFNLSTSNNTYTIYLESQNSSDASLNNSTGWVWHVNDTTRMPPTPINLANTTGNFWVNHTWEAGSGNVTDSYNVSVNGEWFNGTTNLYNNTTLSAHAWANISIEAFNASGRTSLNLTNISQNTTVPNNIPNLTGLPDDSTTEDNNKTDIFDLDTYFTDDDGDTPSFDVESNNQSSNVAVIIDGENRIDYTLAQNWFGIAEIVINVTDGYGGEDNDTFIIEVTSVNDPPVLDDIANQSVDLGENVYINADATDVEDDPLIYSCNRTDLFTDFDTDTGQGNWTTDSTGTFYIDFGVGDDNGGTDNDTVQIIVSQPADFMPPTPINLANTTGNFWVNHTWEAGSGNVTDSYNVSVNGEWFNGTTNLYNNTTLSAHAWANISIEAFNASGNGTLNLTNISQNTTVPNNAPTMEAITNQTVEEEENVYIDANATDIDGDSLIFSCNRTDLFTDFNTDTGQGNWTPSIGDNGTYYIDFGVMDNYSATDNYTMIITVSVFYNITITNWENTYTENNLITFMIGGGDSRTVTYNTTANSSSRWYWYRNDVLDRISPSISTEDIYSTTWDTDGNNTLSVYCTNETLNASSENLIWTMDIYPTIEETQEMLGSILFIILLFAVAFIFFTSGVILKNGMFVVISTVTFFAISILPIGMMPNYYFVAVAVTFLCVMFALIGVVYIFGTWISSHLGHPEWDRDWGE